MGVYGGFTLGHIGVHSGICELCSDDKGIMEKRLVIIMLGLEWKVKVGVSQNQGYVLGGPTKRRIVFSGLY